MFWLFQEKFEKQELHEMQDELEDLRDCGIGGCKPRILQALANIKVRERKRERRKKSMNDRAGSVDRGRDAARDCQGYAS